jgi:hypothetical protein
MIDLRKLFVREMRAHKGKRVYPDSDYHPSDRKGDGLEIEYQAIIAQQFKRWGIRPSCVSVEVRKFGRAPDGFDVFVGMVRLSQWERASGFRVLLGLPLLETKVRKAVRATWLADFSHFGGLWLHASEQLHSMPGASEVRDVLADLVPAPHAPVGQSGVAEPVSPYSLTTLPPTSRPSLDTASVPGEHAAT